MLSRQLLSKWRGEGMVQKDPCIGFFYEIMFSPRERLLGLDSVCRYTQRKSPNDYRGGAFPGLNFSINKSVSSMMFFY